MTTKALISVDPKQGRAARMGRIEPPLPSLPEQLLLDTEAIASEVKRFLDPISRLLRESIFSLEFLSHIEALLASDLGERALAVLEPTSKQEVAFYVDVVT